MTVEEAIKKSFLGGMRAAVYKSSIRAVQEKITPDEELLYALTATVSFRPANLLVASQKAQPGVFAVTTKKLIFSYDVFMESTMRQMDISQVQSVDTFVAKGGRGVTIRITGFTGSFLMEDTPGQIKRLRAAVEQAMMPA